MNQAAVGWVVQRVREWRSAAGISTRLNTAALVEVVEKIEAAGVPDSLACFVVLGCEWMFRLRDLGGADVERRLFRIEQGLTASSFELEDAWIVTEALSASIRKLMKRHRVLAAEMDMQPPPFGGLFGGEVVVPQVSQVDRTARTHRNRSSRLGRAQLPG